MAQACSGEKAGSATRRRRIRPAAGVTGYLGQTAFSVEITGRKVARSSETGGRMCRTSLGGVRRSDERCAVLT